MSIPRKEFNNNFDFKRIVISSNLVLTYHKLLFACNSPYKIKYKLEKEFNATYKENNPRNTMNLLLN